MCCFLLHPKNYASRSTFIAGKGATSSQLTLIRPRCLRQLDRKRLAPMRVLFVSRDSLRGRRRMRRQEDLLPRQTRVREARELRPTGLRYVKGLTAVIVSFLPFLTNWNPPR